MKKVISTTKAPAAIGPYSQAIEANGFVFASGQIPVDPETGVIPEGIEAQAEQVMKNMKNLLEAAGTSIDQVVKTSVFIKNMDDMDLAQALVVADYIAKEQYDGHYTLFGFSTGYRFCFGTLDKVSYHTTNLMPLGKTIEEAIKKAIDEKVDVDVILDREDKMLR